MLGAHRGLKHCCNALLCIIGKAIECGFVWYPRNVKPSFQHYFAIVHVENLFQPAESVAGKWSSHEFKWGDLPEAKMGVSFLVAGCPKVNIPFLFRGLLHRDNRPLPAKRKLVPNKIFIDEPSRGLCFLYSFESLIKKISSIEGVKLSELRQLVV